MKFRGVILGTVLSLMLAACDDGGGAKQSIPERLQAAQTYLDEGETRAALIELRNAAREAPEDPDVQLALAKVLTLMGGYSQAGTTIEKLWETPSNRTPELALARLRQFQLMGQFQKVIDTPLGVDGDQDAATQASHRAFIGMAYLGLSEKEKAKAASAEALALDPNNIEALNLALGLALQEDPKAGQVDTYLARMQKLAPNDPQTLQSEAQVLLATEHFDAAADKFANLAVRFKNGFYSLSQAQALIRATKYQAALDVLDPLAGGLAKNPAYHFLRATAAISIKDYEKTLESANAALALSPDHQASLFLAGSAAFALHEYERAAKFLLGYLADNPDNMQAKRMYAGSLMKLGDIDQALEVIGSLDADSMENVESLALAGAAHAQAGNLTESRDFLKEALAKDPEKIDLKAQLGAVELKLGNAPEATRLFEQVAAATPDDFRIASTLAGLYLQAGAADKAIDLAARVQKVPGYEMPGAMLEAKALESDGQIEAAREKYRALLAADPKFSGAYLGLAKLELDSKNRDGAREIVQQGLKAAPRATELLSFLARLAAQEKDRATAITYFQKVLEQNEASPQIRLELAAQQLAEDQFEPALATLAPILRAADPSLEALRMAASANMALKRGAEAQVIFDQLTQRTPADPTVWLGLAESYRLQGEDNARIRALQRAVEINPEDRTPYFLLMDRLITRRSFAEARDYLKQGRENFPNESRIDVMEGLLYLGEGNPKQAIPFFQAALAASENPSRVVVTYLEVAYWRNDQKDLAFETLDAYIAAHPDDLPMRHHKGLRLLALDRYDAAIAEFGIVLADDPKNVAALNNLAWTYWKKGDIAKALPLAERALAEAPDSPPIEDTAALIYLDNGDVDKAIGLLESALARAPRQASFAFHLAQALDRKGNVDRAMAILEPVLQSDITFAERDEAQALLESLQNKR